MTTIAFDGRTIAADTAQQGSEIFDQIEAVKLYKVYGAVIGVAGCQATSRKFARWYEAGADIDNPPKDIPDEFEALVWDGTNCHSWQKSLEPVPVGVPNAIGTGRAAAMGAMLAGATAEEAVRIACRLDPHTREPVKVINLE